MQEFFFGSGTGHSLMVLVMVIGIGLLLNKLKIKNITLGPVWILFTGIAISAAGIKTDPLFLHFIKEFGLVLFVFNIGMQMGPGFFSSFRGKGLKLNLLSLIMIALSVICFGVLLSFSGKDVPSMLGVLSGAVTNTPAMGTAQQSYYDVANGSFLAEVQNPEVASEIASAFTVVYPVGILCLLLVLFIFRKAFRPGTSENADRSTSDFIETITVQVVNPGVFGLNLSGIGEKFKTSYVVSSLVRKGVNIPVAQDPAIEQGDLLTIDVPAKYITDIEVVFGRIESASDKTPAITGELVKRKLLVTKTGLTGRKLGSLELASKYGVTVTKVNRAGVSLIGRPDLMLQMGDTLSVIGSEEHIKKASDIVGNSSTDLEKPNLVPVFIGIGLGLIVGAIPLTFLGNTIRFGLAAGCIVVSILLGYYGPRFRITTYTTSSANKMMRELGLCLMLGAIGLGAGKDFGRLFCADGATWLLYGAAIALVPAVLTGLIARYSFKLGFGEICGLLTGATTNAPALSTVMANDKNDKTAECYATVYPMAMFLRILAAEIIILIAFA